MCIFSRTELILGKEAMEKLSRSRVAVFGLGGVGGHCAEALVRSGIGALDIIDSDTVSPTNLNRQIIALSSTVGMYKTDAAKERFAQINPRLKLNCHKTFYSPETAAEFDFTKYDYIIDAIDTVTGKIRLVTQAKAAGVPIISCMGTGNKLNPTALEVSDIYKTSVCPLARVMRRELKKRGVDALKVVYSKEEPIAPSSANEALPPGRRQIPGSTSFVPAVAGLIMASEVIKDLCGINKP